MNGRLKKQFAMSPNSERNMDSASVNYSLDCKSRANHDPVAKENQQSSIPPLVEPAPGEAFAWSKWLSSAVCSPSGSDPQFPESVADCDALDVFGQVGTNAVKQNIKCEELASDDATFLDDGVQVPSKRAVVAISTESSESFDQFID